MKMKCPIRNASIAGLALFTMAASASAAGINYTTNDAQTAFITGGSGLTDNSSSGTGGAAATLVFVPNTTSSTGFPSNINLGYFLLTCTGCTTQAVGTGSATFSAFSFDLDVDDTTDGAKGDFVGTSTGGSIFSDTSPIQVNWTTSPVNSLQIGPGTSNASSGNFGTTYFDKVTSITSIVAPNSGTSPGDSTVQGQVNSTTPEPATLALVGGGLLGLGLLRRKKALVCGGAPVRK
jgi:hypothetical protein